MPAVRRLLTIALLVPLLWQGAAGAALAQEGARLDRRIPPADRARHAKQWEKEWRNPRVVVDAAGVYLLLGGEPLGEEARPVEDLAAALAALPVKAWPHGRIVAVSETPRVKKGALPALAPERLRELLDALGVEVVDTPVGCGC